MLLTRDEHLSFFRKNAVLLSETGLHLAEARSIPQPEREDWASAFTAHCVVAFSQKLEDPRWDFGWVRARAANRVWRDWHRVNSELNGRAEVRDIGANAYTRRVGGEGGYLVARNGLFEFVDLSFWRWRSKSLAVNADQICWFVREENVADTQGVPKLDGADWIEFAVHPITEMERSEHSALSPEVGEEIKRLLSGL